MHVLEHIGAPKPVCSSFCDLELRLDAFSMVDFSGRQGFVRNYLWEMRESFFVSRIFLLIGSTKMNSRLFAKDTDCMGVGICWHPHSLSYAGAPFLFPILAPLLFFTCWQSPLHLCMEQYIIGNHRTGILSLSISSRINHGSIAERSCHTTTLSAGAR